MKLDFTERRVVVTGGSRGIGLGIAQAFAAAGAHVSICARGADALAAAAQALRTHGHIVHAAGCDLRDAAQIDAYIREAGETLGGIDVLVNNASGFGLGDDEAAWQAGFQVDLMATVRAGHAALTFLKASAVAGRHPSILNLASISAYMPTTRTPSYAAFKAAVVHYTRSHALALAPARIRVNAIAPGSIEFPGGAWAQRRVEAPDLYHSVADKVPFGRLGTPEEVANVAVFLASEQACWITGQTVTVDGGQILA